MLINLVTNRLRKQASFFARFFSESPALLHIDVAAFDEGSKLGLGFQQELDRINAGIMIQRKRHVRVQHTAEQTFPEK